MGSTVKFTNRALLRLHEALNSLDGSKTGKDELIPFEFTAKVSWNLAKNQVIVERAKLIFDKALRQQAAQAGVKPGESIRVGPDEKPDPVRLQKFAKLQDAIEEMKDQSVDLSGLIFVTLDDLLSGPVDADGNKKHNPIPQSVRAGLVPIIKEVS